MHILLNAFHQLLSTTIHGEVALMRNDIFLCFNVNYKGEHSFVSEVLELEFQTVSKDPQASFGIFSKMIACIKIILTATMIFGGVFSFVLQNWKSQPVSFLIALKKKIKK